MASGDAKRPGESRDEMPKAPGSPAPASSHDDMGVHVSRDLGASGSIARGYNSNMAKLSFSARALPRDEKPAADASASAPPAAPQKPSDATPPAPPEAKEETGGVVSWLTGLITRR